MTYNPQYMSIAPQGQFRQPTPSEKDKIRTNLTFAMFFFFISFIIFMIIAAVLMADYSRLTAMDETQLKETLGDAYRNASSAELALAVQMYLIEGLIMMIWAIIGIVFAFMTRAKAIVPIDRGEFEEGGRFLNILRVMGFIFGIVLAGIFIHKAKKLLKTTAVRFDSGSITQTTTALPSDTTGQVHRCQVCNSLMTFNSGTRMWFCSACNRYQM